MDYVSASVGFRVRKALRYVHLYGVRRALVKIRGQFHMRRSYEALPENHVRNATGAHVGLIGCGNYSFSVIAHYLRKNHGTVIRACMDTNLNRAASMFEHYRASYYTDDASELIQDPRIDLLFIASNHASHAEYAIDALNAGKDVHIEKPHAVSMDQLRRLCRAAQQSTGRIVSIGFNRPGSTIGLRIRELLDREDGTMMQNWFIAGHEIEPDHWYFRDEEGGRILGNLCHWTDLSFQTTPAERRYPIRITPTRSVKSDCDIAVSYVFGDGSIAAITFSAKGHAFEGVKERYAAHRGNTLLAMDDFQRLVADQGSKKTVLSLAKRDHGHERSIVNSYRLSRDKNTPSHPIDYIWNTGRLFLATKLALDESRVVVVEAFDAAHDLTTT
ncbi:MAG: Gfo/Idh/MocA family oxidoreductase [Gammaproteobacteria bacterium]|nr:Gfo/Idh/MocA family oxidoreductase [Gammaproteobacteria bacterium]